MKTIIVGVGEIGKAIKQIEREAGNETFDVDISTPELAKQKYDVMHVCIPYSDMFIKIVANYILKYNPELTIIHSTIDVGTTDTLVEALKVPIVHSPCMGVHPNLYEGIKTFTKIVGGTSEHLHKAVDHLLSLKLNVSCCTSKESELAKLYCTTYYSWNILFAKELNKVCSELNVDFNNVYKVTNEIYNEGYTKLKKTNVVRPILNPPGNEGIGGHCCIENTIILDKSNPNLVTKAILTLGKKSEIKYLDYNWLYCEFIGKNRTMDDIAKECGVERKEINKMLKKFKIRK